MQKIQTRSLVKPAIEWTIFSLAVLGLFWGFKNERFLTLLSAAVLAIAIYHSKRHLGYALVSVPILYYGLMGIFHLGLVVPWAIGLYDPRDVWWFFRVELKPALFLFTLALLGCQLGLILARPRITNSVARAQDPSRIVMENEFLFRVGMAALLVGIGIYLYGFGAVFGWNIADLDYTEMFRLVADRDSRWYGVSLFMIPIGFYSATAAASRKQLRILLVCLSAWAFWQLFLGSRSGALIPAIVVYYICHRKNFRISRRAATIILLLVLYTIPILGVVRLFATSERFRAGSQEEISFMGGFAELGGTIWILVETDRLIGINEYRYGQTYIEALKRVIPSISSNFQAGQRMRSVDLLNSPSYWFLANTTPELLKENLGLGFSSVAEARMNFGPYGVAVVFLLMGCLLARIEAINIPNPYLLAARAMLLGPLLWQVRNDFSVVTRPVIWGLAFLIATWGAAKLIGGIRKTAWAEGGTVDLPSPALGAPIKDPLMRLRIGQGSKVK